MVAIACWYYTHSTSTHEAPRSLSAGLLWCSGLLLFLARLLYIQQVVWVCVVPSGALQSISVTCKMCESRPERQAVYVLLLQPLLEDARDSKLAAFTICTAEPCTTHPSSPTWLVLQLKKGAGALLGGSTWTAVRSDCLRLSVKLT